MAPPLAAAAAGATARATATAATPVLSSSSPSSRRHILPASSLSPHHARPIYGPTDPPGGGGPPAAVGISIRRPGSAYVVDVLTSRGTSIGNEAEMDGLTSDLEAVANGENANEATEGPGTNDPPRRSSTGTAGSQGSGVGSAGGSGRSRRRRRRRLCVPEIVFPGAFVAVRFRARSAVAAGVEASKSEGGGENDGEGGDGVGAFLEVRFDARSALADWAEAHLHLPPPSSPGAPVAAEDSFPSSASSVASAASTASSASAGGGGGGGGGGHAFSAAGGGPSPLPLSAAAAASSRSRSYRGVSVLQTADARLWSDRLRQKRGSGAEAAAAVSDAASAHATEFHYDWTFSTPYAGLVAAIPPASAARQSQGGDDDTTADAEGDIMTETSAVLGEKRWWAPRPTSGLSLPLLTDTTRPILYFDDVTLYEDDLHDNGATVLSIKVRVMPRCLLILARLFVRVDYVLVRVRDVRIFHEFGTGRMCRDVTWRECKWSELVTGAGVPDDVGSWRVEDVAAGAGAAAATQQRLQAMMGRLPEVGAPADIPRHSSVNLDEALRRTCGEEMTR